MSEAIPLAVANIGALERRYVDECLASGAVSSSGPIVSRFEAAFAAHVGAAHAVACSSGTAALHVALAVAGVGADDEVFVSDFTFVATVNPVAYVGAQPLLVDADLATWNMDARLVACELDRRAACGQKQPRAVVVAHVLGLLADLEPIAEACERHGVILIEDAAQALGARLASGGRFGGRQAGTAGLVGCFSFNGNKIMTTGGGGMLTTSDAALAARARHLTTQARLAGPEYLHDAVGYNYRMTAVAAAMGLAQLERLNDFAECKRAIAAKYDEAFRSLPGVTLPPRPASGDPSMWLYSVLIDPEVAGIDRRAVAERLDAAGIQTRPMWAPAHLLPFYKAAPRLGGEAGERLFTRGLSLPCSTNLSPADQARVVDAFSAALSPARTS
jgi:dTDP-4-amino-4,6-dideoxygalactose transaminase